VLGVDANSICCGRKGNGSEVAGLGVKYLRVGGRVMAERLLVYRREVSVRGGGGGNINKVSL
jgi:hypothetical protein